MMMDKNYRLFYKRIIKLISMIKIRFRYDKKYRNNDNIMNDYL